MCKKLREAVFPLTEKLVTVCHSQFPKERMALGPLLYPILQPIVQLPREIVQDC